MTDSAWNRRREPWNPLIGELGNPLEDGDYEAMQGKGIIEGFIKENSPAYAAWDKISDFEKSETSEFRCSPRQTGTREGQVKAGKKLRESRGKIHGERVVRTSNVIVRDMSFIDELKVLYGFRCQVCGEALCCPRNRSGHYVEGHHIQPLGKHDGPDIPTNVIIVCPNHHKVLEYGGMELALTSLKLRKHAMGQEFVDFHNHELVVSHGR